MVKGSLFEEVTFKLNCNDEKGTNENKISGENIPRIGHDQGHVLRVGTSLVCWRPAGFKKGRRLQSSRRQAGPGYVGVRRVA